MSEGTGGVAQPSPTAVNKATGLRFAQEVLSHHDLDVLPELVGDDFVEENPIPGQGPGRDGLRDFLSAMNGAASAPTTPRSSIGPARSTAASDGRLTPPSGHPRLLGRPSASTRRARRRPTPPSGHPRLLGRPSASTRPGSGPGVEPPA